MTDENMPDYQKGTPVWLVYVLLFIFPPAAWFIIWKYRKFHFLFPIILWVYSGTTLLFFLIQAIFIVPKMLSIYAEFNTEIPRIGITAVYGGIIFTLLEIIFAFYLFKKNKTGGGIPKAGMIGTVILYTLHWLVFYLV